ncbi:MAG: bifunctional (p)ppGpp synthetase/guanosine-3',5'-bis(diphosphate) 3'-pyrophosphohydrolase [Alphaproteobacteria bacterium]
MIRQYELVDMVRAYDPNLDEAMLNRAYVFATKAHGNQKRASGDPYYSHPVEVAGILAGLKLDTASIATALLHDTLEDTDATYAEITQSFGPEVAALVEGVTKLSKISFTSTQIEQAENFRKLLIAMSVDIRVLLVKLADRLHNMRTLRFIKSPEKRARIAMETMEIYAPLAGRIGMQEMLEELQDLAFAELNSEARDSVIVRRDFLRQRTGESTGRIAVLLEETLGAKGIKATVSGREKRPYAIWSKMQRKAISFEQLSDIFAFRLIVDSLDECYHALGVIHQRWPVMPGRFKDYISTPKRNNYQSIHTTVIGPDKQRVEIQIRTADMHRMAEYGVAAHWHFKQKNGVDMPALRHDPYVWLRELVDMIEDGESPEQFLEYTKLDLFFDQVFCFTPGGDLIALPRGATPIDFAYAVHTSIGDSCVGCRINGRSMPLQSELQNGDQVEIIRSEAQTPPPWWEGVAVTAKARAAVRRFIRLSQRGEYIALGREIAEKAFRTEDYPFTEKAVGQALKPLKLTAIDEIYEKLGRGLLTGVALMEAAFPGIKMKAPQVPVALPASKDGRRPRSAAIPIRGMTAGLSVHYGECCHPLPGDRIVGIQTTDGGATIHTIDCEILEQFGDTPERWLDVSWDSSGDAPDFFVGRIITTLSNEPGSLSVLSTLIAKNQGNISNLKISGRTPDFFDMLVDIEVRDVKHLSNIIAALRGSPHVSKVERTHG